VRVDRPTARGEPIVKGRRDGGHIKGCSPQKSPRKPGPFFLAINIPGGVARQRGGGPGPPPSKVYLVNDLLFLDEHVRPGTVDQFR
jgi:hypothetical protein